MLSSRGLHPLKDGSLGEAELIFHRNGVGRNRLCVRLQHSLISKLTSEMRDKTLFGKVMLKTALLSPQDTLLLWH